MGLLVASIITLATLTLPYIASGVPTCDEVSVSAALDDCPMQDCQNGTISQEVVRKFRTDGFVTIRGIITRGEILTSSGSKPLGKALKECFDKLREHASKSSPENPLPKETSAPLLPNRNLGESIPFERTYNTWEMHPVAAWLVLAKRFAKVAAKLLGTQSVRLYQDSLFWKLPGDVSTPFHRDAVAAPFELQQPPLSLEGDQPSMITMWLPLTERTSAAMGTLQFAVGSHNSSKESQNRNTKLPHAYVRRTYELKSAGDMLRLGDATFHHGLTIHGSGANRGATPRRALAVQYITADTKVYSTSEMLKMAKQRRLTPDDSPSVQRWIGELDQAAHGRSPTEPVTPDHRLLPILI